MRINHVSDVIRSAKFDINLGKWSTGHIPRTSFPLSKVKPRNYKYGSDYSWRLVQFEISRGRFRILILVNEPKLIFRATLAAEASDGDMIVLCQHEYHQSEPGWHCHITFQTIDKVPHGAARSHLQRWPQHKRTGVYVTPSISVVSALSIAAQSFRFSAQGDLI